MTQTTTIKKRKKQQIFAEKDFNIGLITPLTKNNNAEIFIKSVEALCELGFNIEILASGDKNFQDFCFNIANKYPQNLIILEDLPQNKAKILRKSDLIIFPGICEDQKLLREITKRGKVSVMPFNNKTNFSNFNAQNEVGESFLFNQDNQYEFLAIIIRAFENFKFSYDWNSLKKRIKKLNI